MGSTRTATVRLDVRDWTMEYEAGGLRTKRSSAEKTYNYIYNGNQLVRMTVGDDILDFTYDANGAPLTLIHNGTVYYYITNLQGDVISLETTDGMQGAHYYYDAWGKILACDGTLAELNPLRYRSYVYDQETGFYYLQSRYYDPAIGRFLNADVYISTGQGMIGNNMFTYCNNNPVEKKDSEGSLGVIAGAAIGGAIGAIGGAVGGVIAMVASAGVGAISATMAVKSTEGSAEKKFVAGVTALLIVGAGTYYGTRFPLALETSFNSGVTSFSGGLFTGLQTETINVVTQQLVSSSSNNRSHSSNTQAKKRQISREGGGKGVERRFTEYVLLQ